MQPDRPTSTPQPILRFRHRRPLHKSPSQPERTDENTHTLRPIPAHNDLSIRFVRPPTARPMVDDEKGRDSEGPTIRGIRTAFLETPIRLRELEVGWREKRRAGLAERKLNGVVEQDREGRKMAVNRSEEGHDTHKNSERIVRRSRINEESVHLTDERQTRVSAVEIGRQKAHLRDHLSAPNIDRKEVPNAKHKASPIEKETTIHLAPPSPPLTPPLIPDRVSPYQTNRDKLTPTVRPSKVRAHKRVTALPTTDDEQSCTAPLPILTSPLPPTSHPVPFGKRSRDTIHIHPSPCDTGITLNLGGSEIQISSDGTTVTFWSNAEKGMTLDRTLSLGSAKKWSEGDKRDWELVRRLVQGYKRHIPKVRLYLPLGHITITCSSPPDVILSFGFASTHCLPQGTRTRAESDLRRTKVKLRLSRMNSEIVIDTSATPQTGERLRTRRTIPIDRKTREDGVSDGVPLMDDLQDILLGSEDWLEAEKEGLRRLIQLKEEWERYG